MTKSAVTKIPGDDKGFCCRCARASRSLGSGSLGSVNSRRCAKHLNRKGSSIRKTNNKVMPGCCERSVNTLRLRVRSSVSHHFSQVLRDFHGAVEGMIHSVDRKAHLSQNAAHLLRVDSHSGMNVEK